jgi:hypothetical protein
LVSVLNKADQSAYPDSPSSIKLDPQCNGRIQWHQATGTIVTPRPASVAVPVFNCPTDVHQGINPWYAVSGADDENKKLGKTNYLPIRGKFDGRQMVSWDWWGDGWEDGDDDPNPVSSWAARGGLFPNSQTDESRFSDGLSNTLLFGEVHSRYSRGGDSRAYVWIGGGGGISRFQYRDDTAEDLTQSGPIPVMYCRALMKGTGMYMHQQQGGSRINHPLVSNFGGEGSDDYCSSLHTAGANFCNADGSVIFLSETISPAAYEARGTACNGDSID